jgi:drug/metabolite transporter (DMT)-like permease
MKTSLRPWSRGMTGQSIMGKKTDTGETSSLTRHYSPPGERTESTLPPLGFFLLAAISLLWGVNWPIMKTALTEIPPWTFRLFCLVFGGSGLFLVVKASGRSLAIPKGEIKPLLLVSLLNITGWHLFSAHGLAIMSAGRASIIAFTMPVWAAILSSFILKERLTKGRFIGLALGISGLMVLIGPDLKVFGAEPVGAFFMLVAALSWAAGTVSIKYFHWTMPIALLTAWQLILGGIPIVIGAVILEPVTIVFRLSWLVTISLIYVILVPIIFCQWAWFKVLDLFPASLAAIGTLLIPVIGVFSSAMLLGESVGLRELVSLMLVVTALAVVMIRPD